MGPNEPIPIPAKSAWYCLKKSMTKGIVSSGVVVGKLTLSLIVISSSPMAHTNFVPPASIEPYNMHIAPFFSNYLLNLTLRHHLL